MTAACDIRFARSRERPIIRHAPRPPLDCRHDRFRRHVRRRASPGRGEDGAEAQPSAAELEAAGQSAMFGDPLRAAARRRAAAGRTSRSPPRSPIAVLARKYRPQTFSRVDRAGADGAHARQRDRARPAGARVPDDRRARGRQDLDRAADRQGAQLRRARRAGRPDDRSVRRVRAVRGHRRRPPHRRDRDGRREPHRRRRRARDHRGGALRRGQRRATRSTSSTKSTCSRATRSTPCSRRSRNRRRT